MKKLFHRFLLLPCFLIFVVPISAQQDTSRARALLREAMSSTTREQYQDAAASILNGLAIMDETGNRETALYASLLHQYAVVLLKTSRPDTAIVVNRSALAIRERILGYVSEPVARSLLNIGQCYYSKLNMAKSREFSLKSLAIARKLPPGMEEAAASAYNNISNSYVQSGDVRTALLFADSALQIRLAAVKPDTVNLVISFNNTGNLFTLLGLYDKSVPMLERSLELKLAYYGKWHRETAIAYCNLGAAVFFSGNNERSLQLVATSLEIRKKVLQPDDFEMAESFANIMLPLVATGDYDKAVEYGKNALSVVKKYGLRGAYISGIVHLATGNSLVYKDELDAAIEQYESALNFFALTRNNALAADVLNNIGGACGQNKDYASQKKHFRQALNRKMAVDRTHPSLALNYVNLGLAFMNNNEPDSALLFLDMAENHLRKNNALNSGYMTTLHNTRANIFTMKGNFDGALAELEKALSACGYREPGNYRDVTHFDDLLTTLTELGGLWKARYSSSPDTMYALRARKALLEAQQLVNDKLVTFSEQGSRTALNRRIIPLYESLVAVDLLLNRATGDSRYLEEAFRMSEASKAINLLQAVRNSGALQFRDIPSETVSGVEALEAEIGKIGKKLSEAEVAGEAMALLADSLRITLTTRKEALQSLMSDISATYPDYYNARFRAEPQSVFAVRDSLLEPGQALLEYFAGDKAVYAFLVTSDTLLVHEIPLDFPLENWIDSLRLGLYGYYAAPDSARTPQLLESSVNKYLRFARLLCEKLVTPLEPLLPERLVVVPDGPIGYIPFDALLSDSPKNISNFKGYDFLLKRHQFSYACSATLLREMRNKRHKSPPENSFIAFAPFIEGNPAGLKNMYRLDELLRSELTPLPYSGAEVAAAAKLMNGDIVAGPTATEEKFCSVASRYRIIHLSTHGKADNRIGDYAYLAFAEVADSVENELLFVRELYNLELNSDLVVLSACETGTGKLQRGEGIISVARAFAYAGARSTVTSLWEVNDQSTAGLTRYFYRELRAGASKDEALRKARLQYIREATVRQAHPFFWAALMPAGDMRALSK
jgi:CHAT domain-containing protein/tetratricopeptide (TPR) repeat protein